MNRTPNYEVVTTITNSLQQYNSNLVENTNYSAAEALAPAVMAMEGALNCNIVAKVENEVPVQTEQKDEANKAASHD
eukprot:5029314-Amphidinium_carterae.1